LKHIWVRGTKTQKTEKVTGSQDDGFLEEVEDICLGVHRSKKSQAVRMTKKESGDEG
jgi:hypothetical protein